MVSSARALAALAVGSLCADASSGIRACTSPVSLGNHLCCRQSRLNPGNTYTACTSADDRFARVLSTSGNQTAGMPVCNGDRCAYRSSVYASRLINDISSYHRVKLLGQVERVELVQLHFENESFHFHDARMVLL